jgi:hypothetical protein
MDQGESIVGIHGVAMRPRAGSMFTSLTGMSTYLRDLKRKVAASMSHLERADGVEAMGKRQLYRYNLYLLAP